MKSRFAVSAIVLLFAALPLLAQQAKGPHPKNKQEQDALQKVQAAQQAAQQNPTPENFSAEIDAINNVLENFTNTDFKPLLMNMAMDAAEKKNDFVQVVTWGERIMQSDPNDIPSRVTLAEAIAQHTRENDLDKADSLKKVQTYANKALDLLKTANTAPAGVPEEQWPAYKKQLTSQSYDALGQAAALDKNFADAINNYKQAIDADPTSSVAQARLAKAYVDNKQYDDAISAADKVLAMNTAPPVVKQFAQQQKDAATKLKSAK